MTFSNIKLTIDTIKYLKIKQVYYRVYYIFRNRFVNKTYNVELQKSEYRKNWENKFHSKNSLSQNNTFQFLNIKHKFNDKIDWNYNEFGKLWTYNLNYFEYLNQINITKNKGLHLINDFIEDQVNIVDGFEPYPVSLRAMNWIKFLSVHEVGDAEINRFLYIDYLRLIDNLEYHILGNHLLENGFALLFGAYYFEDTLFYAKASKILRKELDEQILEDGAHFELSPMYHQIVLNRLLDCIYLLNNNNIFKDDLYSLLKNKASEMLSWLETIEFKNGDIPMVNDSTYGIALSSYEIFKYAKELDLTWKKSNLSDSGYRKYSNDKYECFLDVGKIGPNYQPGHSHADTFSFILHLMNKPIIVDPGVSTYENNEVREKERSTMYHNTVTVNDMNSSQVWGGFRVAKRANVVILNDSNDEIIAEHDGFSKLSIKHQRKFKFDKRTLIIEDNVSNDSNAKAFFHLHPSCKIKKVNERSIFLEDLKISFDGTKNIHIEEYQYSLGFNDTVSSKKIAVPFTKKLRSSFTFN